MNYERFNTAVKAMENICEEINITSNDIEYVVLQGIDSSDEYARDPFIIHRITEFYNDNWLGNKDYMHIPDFYQTEYNCNNYPIIIARDRNTKEIVGISTIKYEENSSTSLDPYYPILGEKYFSITGILTKKNNTHKGIGKKIYEIALRGAAEFNNFYKDTSIMCVIDCRNKNSINAIYSATNNINEKNLLPGHILSSRIDGFYTVTDENNQMVEAPTIVIKVDNNSNMLYSNRRTIEYRNDDDLFTSLLTTMRNHLEESNISSPIVNMDEEAGLVSFYHVHNNNCLPNVITNGTEQGNDRIPNKPTNIQGPYQLRLIKNRKTGEEHAA